MAENPWSHSRTERETGVPFAPPPQQTARYAAPGDDAGDAYNDEFGWAPKLAQRTSAVETPSAQRLQTITRQDYRPDPVRPPQEFWGRIDADDRARESVVDQDATGWTIKKGVNVGDRRWADNPRRDPPPEERLTQQLGPRTYSFIRPFDQGYARRFNGVHFSMADHRRKYDILGMAPVRTSRNTYRIEPAPWDVDIVDKPAVETQQVPGAVIRSVELPYNSRSQRLM